MEGAGINQRITIDKIAIHHLGQMKGIIAHTRKTDNSRGRSIDDIRSFIESIMVSVSNSPTNNNTQPSPYMVSKIFEILKSSTYRKIHIYLWNKK